MTKAQIFILWGLAALVVVVFVGLGQVISRPPQGSAPLPTRPAQVYSLPGIPYSARSLYQRADQAARSWQGDARLVSAATSWSFAGLDDFSRPTDWTFQFFSPATQKIYVVNVNEAEVTPLREALSPYVLSTIAIDHWRFDSYEALNQWLNQGGGDFMRAHPIVDVSIRLRQSEEGRPEWGVVGMVRDSQTLQLSRMDAVDGTLLQ